MEAMAPEMEFASEVPVIEGMAVDVHTASGNCLGTLRAAEFWTPDAFGPDDLMAYIEVDELSVPFVRMLRLVNLGPSS